MKLGGDDLQFLARFNRSPDGAALLKILRAKLAESDKALRTARGEDVLRAQGRAIELDELVADITEAEQKLKRNVPSRLATPHAAP